MHAGAVDGAAEQLLERQHAVAVVQVQAAEYLVRQVAQARAQVVAAVARVAQAGLFLQLFGQAAPGQFQRGGDARALGRAQPAGADRLVGPAEQRAQAAGVGEQLAAQRQASLPRLPLPSSTASSSASDSAALPRASSFSRGRSPSGQSRMLMRPSMRAGMAPRGQAAVPGTESGKLGALPDCQARLT